MPAVASLGTNNEELGEKTKQNKTMSRGVIILIHLNITFYRHITSWTQF